MNWSFTRCRSVRIALVLIAICVVPFAASRLASPWRCVSIHTTDRLPEPQDATPGQQLRVASYNIAHGRGLVDSNWDGGSSVERLRRLDEIADLLREMDADIVILNEVDFESSWSHSVNQARYLAEHAGYPYWVEQRNYDFRILTWTWRFGNAVLSRHPVSEADVIPLPGFAAWETILAGKKRGVDCEITVRGQPVRVIGAHLSHRSESLRVNSARVLSEIVSSSRIPVIVAGDMNSTPSGFPRSITTTGGANAMDTLDACGWFRRSPAQVTNDEVGFTFHSARPRSIIDWILIPRRWDFLRYEVLASGLSDHRPIIADVSPATD